jgi:hypothetical protein
MCRSEITAETDVFASALSPSVFCSGKTRRANRIECYDGQRKSDQSSASRSFVLPSHFFRPK